MDYTHIATDVVELQQAVVSGKQQPGVRLATRASKDARLPANRSKTHRPRMLLPMAELPTETTVPEAVILQPSTFLLYLWCTWLE
jgi:hypothetical protein